MFSASTTEVRQITVMWDGLPGAYSADMETVVRGYELYRTLVGVPSSPESLLYRGVDAYYLDAGLDNDQSFDYYYRSFDTVNGALVYDPLVGPVTGTTLAEPGAPVLTSQAQDRAVLLTWTVAVGADFYRLYRDGVPVYTGTNTTVTDPVALNDLTYVYRVAGVNAAAETFSTEVSSTPTSAPVDLSVADLGISAYLRQTWSTYVSAETTQVALGTGAKVPVSFVPLGGAALNESAITLVGPALPYTGSITGYNSAGVALWTTEPDTFTSYVIAARDLIVLAGD